MKLWDVICKATFLRVETNLCSLEHRKLLLIRMCYVENVLIEILYVLEHIGMCFWNFYMLQWAILHKNFNCQHDCMIHHIGNVLFTIFYVLYHIERIW